MVGCKFTIFALFYFVFEGNFPVSSPQGAYIWRGELTEGFLRYRFGGLILGGAYTWRGLFSEFYGMDKDRRNLGIIAFELFNSFFRTNLSRCSSGLTECLKQAICSISDSLK